jgi:hypothetical protein
MIYRLTIDDIISFGSEVKSVFNFFITSDLEKEFLQLNHEFNLRLSKDFFSYFVIDAHPNQEVNDILRELGIAGTPSLVLRVFKDMDEKTFSLNFENVKDYLSYIDLILQKNTKEISKYDPKHLASTELINYLRDTLKIIN